MTMRRENVLGITGPSVAHLLVGLLTVSLGLFAPGGDCAAERLTLVDFPGDLVTLEDTVTIVWAEEVKASLRYSRMRGDGLPQNYPRTLSRFIVHEPGIIQFDLQDQVLPGIYYCIVTDGRRSSPEFILAVSSRSGSTRHSFKSGSTVSATARGADIVRFSTADKSDIHLAEDLQEQDADNGRELFTSAELGGPSLSGSGQQILAGTGGYPAGQAVSQTEFRSFFGNRKLRVQTNARGPSAISNEPDVRELTVPAEKKGSPQAEMITAANTNAEKNSILIPRACLVSGRILDGHGEAFGPPPLGGVLITLEDPAGMEISDTTNSLGVYMLSVPSGSYLLRAQKDGYEPSRAQKVTVTSASILQPDLVLNPQSDVASLTGSVTWGSEPVPEITVAIWSLTQGTTDTTWTEDDGHFSFDELPAPDTYVLEVCQEGFDPLSSGPIWVSAPETQWDFHYPAGKISWLITAAGNIAMPGVRVHLKGQDVDTTLWADETGACETPPYLKAGEYMVSIVGDAGYLTAAPYRLLLGDDESRVEKVSLPIQQEPSAGSNGANGKAQVQVFNEALLDHLEILGPQQPMISNQSQAIFRYVALDSSGQEMDIQPRWSFQPREAGLVTYSRNEDMISFDPHDDFIGQVRITLSDSISGQTVEYNAADSIAECDRGLGIYCLLTGDNSEISLADGNGFRLLIPNSALPQGSTTQISLRKPSVPDVKRYTPRHEIHGQVYDLRTSNEIAFLYPLHIVLPIVPEARSLHAIIGRWDFHRLEWEELGGVRAQEEISTEVDHLSQFAVLGLSKPLAVDHLQLLPNPFTPHDPYGLQLGFTLSTDCAREPFVTIKVYNMTGDLVRTICENEPMPKGTYLLGENFLDSRGRDITSWDGRTDSGEMARNGRYLVYFKVEDSAGTAEVRKTAVLIK